jgi:small subunit ribosomal protein S1
MKQLRVDPWESDIPSRYQPNQLVKGKVTKLTNFGVFVELEPGLEGLLHISELAGHKVDSPEDVVKVGDELECKVLRVDLEERKIGLSRKRVGAEEPEVPAETGDRKPTKEKERVPAPKLKGGIGGGGGLLIDPAAVKSPKPGAETAGEPVLSPEPTVADPPA